MLDGHIGIHTDTCLVEERVLLQRRQKEYNSGRGKKKKATILQ